MERGQSHNGGATPINLSILDFKAVYKIITKSYTCPINLSILDFKEVTRTIKTTVVDAINLSILDFKAKQH